MKSDDTLVNEKDVEKFNNALKKLGLNSTPEMVECILELQKEIQEGKLDERALEFVKNLEDTPTDKNLTEADLDSVAGGASGAKKYWLWLRLYVFCWVEIRLQLTLLERMG